MNTSSAIPQKHVANQVGMIESLMELGQYVDRNAGAVTFCFGVSSFADKAHREELLGVEHLVDGAKAESSGVRKDLAKIRSMAEEIRATPSAFRAIFAGSDGGVWREFSVPVSNSASSLEVGARFRIVSLLRALEACTPYAVVFVEHGKARIFKVRGMEIVEFDGPIPSEDLTLYNDDSRVGWSHHIDKNVEERTKAYLRGLAGYLKEFMGVAHFTHLVVGCRGDVWSEFEPELARAGIGALVAGQFHLPYFAITPNEALKAGAPVFKHWQEQRYEDFWQEISDHRLRGVVGVQGVLEGLEAGRVQRLFLGKACDDALFECLDCGKWQVEGGTCLSCSGLSVVPTTAGEVLVRLAFRSGAEILAPSDETPYAPDAVGALLRY